MQKNAYVNKSNRITGRVVKNEGANGQRICEVAQTTAFRPPALTNPWTPKSKREPSSGGAFGKKHTKGPLLKTATKKRLDMETPKGRKADKSPYERNRVFKNTWLQYRLVNSAL